VVARFVVVTPYSPTVRMMVEEATIESVSVAEPWIIPVFSSPEKAKAVVAVVPYPAMKRVADATPVSDRTEPDAFVNEAV
jgi:hypothetical protein